MRALRRALGILLALVIRPWVSTLRVVFEDDAGAELGQARGVFAFFHGQQMALLRGVGRRHLLTLVSRSKDGELQTGVLGQLGFRIVRGSSSRGGASALRRLVLELRAGGDAAFAVDGPRGPFGVPKAGAAFAAAHSGVPLRPVASAPRRAIVLGRSWDRFEIPLPFSRVAIVVGPPFDPALATEYPGSLGAAIRRARARAEALASVPGARA